MVEETRVLRENHILLRVTGNFLTCLDSSERQLSVSGNTLDYTAIRAGPILFEVQNRVLIMLITHMVNISLVKINMIMSREK